MNVHIFLEIFKAYFKAVQKGSIWYYSMRDFWGTVFCVYLPTFKITFDFVFYIYSDNDLVKKHTQLETLSAYN